MRVTRPEVQSRFQRYVAVRVAGTEDELHGKVLEVSDDAFVLQTRTDTRVIQYVDVTSLIERRRGVTRRRLRLIGAGESVRQHLADRHAIFVSLLRVAGEDTLRDMHDKINHSDLGHMHVRPEDDLESLGEPAEDDDDH
jgi:hypothetical protein